MTEATGPAPKRASRAISADAENKATATGSNPPAPPPRPAFPYKEYLEERDGASYLPLRWRLAWLRADHPQARVSTSLVSHENGTVVFRALIKLPDGGTATGWGARNNSDGGFDGDGGLDYLTYAENQALSRALTVLGYGNEYALDFDPPLENPAIPLPETADEEEDEPGIVVPMAAEVAEPEARPVRGEIRNLAERRPSFPARPTPTPSPAIEDDEEDDIEDDEPEDDEEEASPTPLRARESLAMPRLSERPAIPRPLERPSLPAEPVTEPAPVIGSSAVDSRIKNVRDESLRILLKRIYYEARQRFNMDEETVDKRSRATYNKPAYELDNSEADQFLERIITASRRRQ